MAKAKVKEQQEQQEPLPAAEKTVGKVTCLAMANRSTQLPSGAVIFFDAQGVAENVAEADCEVLRGIPGYLVK